MALLNKLSSFNLSTLMKTRTNAVSAVALALVTCILLFLTYGQLTSTLAVNRNLAVEQQKITQLNRKAQELEQLKFSPEFTQAEQINRVLPSHKPLLELLNNLNAVAGETRVAITEFEINPGEIATDSTQAVSDQVASRKKNTDYDQLDLKLTIVGQLGQVRQFMDLIERVTPLTTITSLTVDQKTGVVGTSDSATRADLSLSTYYYTKSISSTLSSTLPEISAQERQVFQAILDFTPTQVEKQTGIIGGTNQDLFDINGLSVTDLEQQLQLDTLETGQ